jgi:protein gp37
MDRRHLERRQRLQRVSPGCTNCYAMRLAGTRLKHHPSRQGLTIDTKAGPVWNGETRFNDKVLLDPLSGSGRGASSSARTATCFTTACPTKWIDQVFAVMALAPQHQFQVLTKRAQADARLSDGPTAARITSTTRAMRDLPGR